MYSKIFFLNIIFTYIFHRIHTIIEFFFSSQRSAKYFFSSLVVLLRERKKSFTNRKTFLSIILLQSTLRKTMKALNELYSASTIRIQWRWCFLFLFFSGSAFANDHIHQQYYILKTFYWKTGTDVKKASTTQEKSFWPRKKNFKIFFNFYLKLIFFFKILLTVKDFCKINFFLSFIVIKNKTPCLASSPTCAHYTHITRISTTTSLIHTCAGKTISLSLNFFFSLRKENICALQHIDTHQHTMMRWWKNIYSRKRKAKQLCIE